MVKKIISKLNKMAKNFVLIGEAGSGKTELSLSLAAEMQKLGERQVYFLDMDQTKPLLRARDSEAFLRRAGVEMPMERQFMDAPTVLPGVMQRLGDPKVCAILDIGGGAYGSHMIAQFEEAINSGNTATLYLVNPYRPWSRTREAVEETMRRTVGAAAIKQVHIVANPNLGYETDANAIIEGVDKIKKLFPEKEILFLCVDESLADELEVKDLPDIFPVSINNLPAWLQ